MNAKIMKTIRNFILAGWLTKRRFCAAARQTHRSSNSCCRHKFAQQDNWASMLQVDVAAISVTSDLKNASGKCIGKPTEHLKKYNILKSRYPLNRSGLEIQHVDK